MVKPHHAGRWLSLNRSRLAENANILVIDPKDPEWQPFAAPALINAVDAVLTTPSTVALDAALAGKPVAVLGYSLDLPLYSPLAIIRSEVDWDDFLMHASELSSWSNAAFPGVHLCPVVLISALLLTSKWCSQGAARRPRKRQSGFPSIEATFPGRAAS